MTEAYPWLARLLQVSDSAFPTGGYAHSYGFEQIVHFGLVHDADSMARHIERHLWPMLVHLELPAVRLAQQAALANDLPALIELDLDLDATKSARESREASQTTGRRRLLAFSETAGRPILREFSQAVEDGTCFGHHAVVFGLGLAALPQRALLTSWAFQSLSAICLSAPKLLRVGQNAAQRVLTSSLVNLDANVAASLAISRDDFGWFDPLADLASMHHEIAHERLFIS